MTAATAAAARAETCPKCDDPRKLVPPRPTCTLCGREMRLPAGESLGQQPLDPEEAAEAAPEPAADGFTPRPRSSSLRVACLVADLVLIVVLAADIAVHLRRPAAPAPAGAVR